MVYPIMQITRQSRSSIRSRRRPLKLHHLPIRGERLTGDLKFSAKPEVALAILCDLETSPDIDQFSIVRLSKDQNGKVKVHYVLEAWVIASEGSSSAAGAAL